MGVDEATANFAASFGMSIGQNGCAGIYPAMLATIIAPTVGIDVFSPTFVAGLVAVVMISSLGVAGVGGGATFASLIVLGTMGLPHRDRGGCWPRWSRSSTWGAPRLT